MVWRHFVFGVKTAVADLNRLIMGLKTVVFGPQAVVLTLQLGVGRSQSGDEYSLF
jgi:hypothetical protein